MLLTTCIAYQIVTGSSRQLKRKPAQQMQGQAYLIEGRHNSLVVQGEGLPGMANQHLQQRCGSVSGALVPLCHCVSHRHVKPNVRNS